MVKLIWWKSQCAKRVAINISFFLSATFDKLVETVVQHLLRYFLGAPCLGFCLISLI